jgi:hypothetical protein
LSRAVDARDGAMTDSFEQMAPQLNSKNGKKNGPVFYKTFSFIPAGAGITYE